MQRLHRKKLYFWSVPGSIMPDKMRGKIQVCISREEQKRFLEKVETQQAYKGDFQK